MPEEKGGPSPSGVMPEGKRKPTVIGGAPVNPSAGVPPGRQPTVIRTPPLSTHVQPTQVPGPTKIAQKATVAGVPQALPVVSQPTAVKGVIRKGVEVDRTTLARCFAGTSDEVIVRVQQILKETVIDLLTDATCVYWGEENQKRFGEITERSLELVSSDTISSATAHLRRLQTILQELADSLGPSKGWFGKHAEPSEVFEQHRSEMKQLRTMLKNLSSELLRVESELVSLNGELSTLAVLIDADNLAAKYIVEHLLDKSRHDRMIETLQGKSLSLTKTVARIAQGRSTRDAQAGVIRQLVAQIQDAVFNALPAWVQNVIVVFGKADRTETDMYTVRTGLNAILQQFSPSK